MRTKEAIHTSRLVDGPNQPRKPIVRGAGMSDATGLLTRISLLQRVHSGPQSVLDRRVELVLTIDDALTLAIDLLECLPIGELEQEPAKERARQAIRLLSVVVR